jgi:GRAM domain
MKVLTEDARLAQRFFMAMALTVSRQLKAMNAQHVLDLHAGTALSGKVTNFDVDAFLKANNISSTDISNKDDDAPDSHRDINLHELCEVPATDRTVGSWPCQIERDSLDLRGRLFVTTNFLCIYSRFFNFESNFKLRLRDIQKVG